MSIILSQKAVKNSLKLEALCISLTCISTADKCTQRPDPVPCDSDDQRWYYDDEEGKCEAYDDGECPGNANNFASRKECREACPGSETAIYCNSTSISITTYCMLLQIIGCKVFLG